jgi:hypothetical protein
MHPASHLRLLLTDAYELSDRLLHVQMNNILMLTCCLCLCRLGEVPDTFIWAPPRLLGSLLPHRHGVPTTVHGLVNHRHFKAWKARREEHPAMLDAISINSMFACLPLGIKTRNVLGRRATTLYTSDCITGCSCNLRLICLFSFCLFFFFTLSV